jgi:hypothetical protein
MALYRRQPRRQHSRKDDPCRAFQASQERSFQDARCMAVRIRRGLRKPLPDVKQCGKESAMGSAGKPVPYRSQEARHDAGKTTERSTGDSHGW